MKRDGTLLNEVAEVMKAPVSLKAVIETTDVVSALLAAREVLNLPEGEAGVKKTLMAQRLLHHMDNTPSYRVYIQILKKRGISDE